MKHSLLKIAKALLKLEYVDTLALSAFSNNKALIAILKKQGLILPTPNVTGRGYVVSKGPYYQDYIDRTYAGDIASFIDADSRAELVSVYGDDKATKIAPQKGLFVWTEDNIAITASTIVCREEGVVTFIHERLETILSDDVTIVGVENFESLTYAADLKKHFSFPEKSLFVYRNSSFNALIKEANQRILYIPDYDVFGIRIFETEVLKYNPCAELLVPHEVENIFEQINTTKKYFEQSQMKGAKYTAISKDGKLLLDLIRHYKKIIPQEYLHYKKKDALKAQ